MKDKTAEWYSNTIIILHGNINSQIKNPDNNVILD